jgi:hypothetical protein
VDLSYQHFVCIISLNILATCLAHHTLPYFSIKIIIIIITYYHHYYYFNHFSQYLTDKQCLYNQNYIFITGTRQRARAPRNQGSIPRRGRDLFLTQSVQIGPCPHSLLSNGYWSLFRRNKMVGEWRWLFFLEDGGSRIVQNVGPFYRTGRHHIPEDSRLLTVNSLPKSKSWYLFRSLQRCKLNYRSP